MVEERWATRRLRELGILGEDGKLYLRVGLLISCPAFYLAETPITNQIYYGTETHRFIQRILQEYGFIPEYEVRYEYSDNIVLVGHPDAVNNDNRIVFEIKTTRLKRPVEKYRLQLAIYKYMLERLTGKRWKAYFLFIREPVSELSSPKIKRELEVLVENLLSDNVFLLPPTKTVQLHHLPRLHIDIELYIDDRIRFLKRAFEKGIAPRIPGEQCEKLDCPLREKCREYMEWKEKLFSHSNHTLT